MGATDFSRDYAINLQHPSPQRSVGAHEDGTVISSNPPRVAIASNAVQTFACSARFFCKRIAVVRAYEDGAVIPNNPPRVAIAGDAEQIFCRPACFFYKRIAVVGAHEDGTAHPNDNPLTEHKFETPIYRHCFPRAAFSRTHLTD